MISGTFAETCSKVSFWRSHRRDKREVTSVTALEKSQVRLPPRKTGFLHRTSSKTSSLVSVARFPGTDPVAVPGWFLFLLFPVLVTTFRNGFPYSQTGFLLLPAPAYQRVWVTNGSGSGHAGDQAGHGGVGSVSGHPPIDARITGLRV